MRVLGIFVEEEFVIEEPKTREENRVGVGGIEDASEVLKAVTIGCQPIKTT